jgi:hypothetical protein
MELAAVLFAAIAAVAALATVYQARAAGRERRLADAAEAVAALDQGPDYRNLGPYRRVRPPHRPGRGPDPS